MTHVDKHKLKSRLTIVAFGVFGLFIAWMSDASAVPSYFSTKSCDGAGCHNAAPVVVSCDGCHAHGTHISNGFGAMNVTASTDKTSYTLGETIIVTISGGGGDGGWFRGLLYDSNGIELDRSSGCSTIDQTGMTPCSDGEEYSTPVTVSVLADTLGTGTHNITAAWFGNMYEGGGAFGSNTSSVTVPGWMVDPAVGGANSTHGQEIVAVAEFTITDPNAGTGGGTTPAPAPAPTTTTSSSGGGSLSWPLIVMILIAIAAMLIRDRRMEQELVNIKK